MCSRIPDLPETCHPFLRLNISYKRITQNNDNRDALSLSSQKHVWLGAGYFCTSRQPDRDGDRAERLSDLSQAYCDLFLSRFFFKDKTPHLVILVKDWMRFSTELESMRTGTDPEPGRRQKRPRNSILSRLATKMNIYFACSITGGREFESVYQVITQGTGGG